jgi:hypothetical protein
MTTNDVGPRFCGDIPELVGNTTGLYEGNLIPYLRTVLAAPNVHNGYHGLRHMLHVTWVCYRACKYYKSSGLLTPRSMRNLLVGAMFHDYGHPGAPRADIENIRVAIAGFKRYAEPVDKPFTEEISRIIWATEYPHQPLPPDAPLEWAIIRDADVSQALNSTWIGDILGGLGHELGLDPLRMLQQQEVFLNHISWLTDFARAHYGEEAIGAKIKEVRALLAFTNA